METMPVFAGVKSPATDKGSKNIEQSANSEEGKFADAFDNKPSEENAREVKAKVKSDDILTSNADNIEAELSGQSETPILITSQNYHGLSSSEGSNDDAVGTEFNKVSPQQHDNVLKQAEAPDPAIRIKVDSTQLQNEPHTVDPRASGIGLVGKSSKEIEGSVSEIKQLENRKTENSDTPNPERSKGEVVVEIEPVAETHVESSVEHERADKDLRQGVAITQSNSQTTSTDEQAGKDSHSRKPQFNDVDPDVSGSENKPNSDRVKTVDALTTPNPEQQTTKNLNVLTTPAETVASEVTKQLNPLLSELEFIAARSDFSGDRSTITVGERSSGIAAQQLTLVPQKVLPNSIVEQLNLAVSKRTNGALEIQLDPVELGKVRLQISPTEMGQRIIVTADRPEILDLLRKNEDVLAAEFAEQGFENSNLQFEQNSTDDDANEFSPESVVLEQSHSLDSSNSLSTTNLATLMDDGSLDIRL